MLRAYRPIVGRAVVVEVAGVVHEPQRVAPRRSSTVVVMTDLQNRMGQRQGGRRTHCLPRVIIFFERRCPWVELCSLGSCPIPLLGVASIHEWLFYVKSADHDGVEAREACSTIISLHEPFSYVPQSFPSPRSCKIALMGLCKLIVLYLLRSMPGMSRLSVL